MLLRDEFLIEDHKSMVENMNRISDDLLKAYWYFLATIAALGFSYKTILDFANKLKLSSLDSFEPLNDIPLDHILTNFTFNGTVYTTIGPWIFFAVCLIGNIVFWKIGEYATSHGFLFRFVQARAATIEKEAYNEDNNFSKKMGLLASDPTEKKRWIKEIKNTKRLNIDHVLPDQFVPLYWASIWLIIINTVIACSLQLILSDGESLQWIFIYSISTSLLIWKHWEYTLHKIKQFFNNSCTFNFIDCRKYGTHKECEHYFIFPKSIGNYRLLFVIIQIILVIILAIFNDFYLPAYLIVLILIVVNIHITAGILIHLLYYILNNRKIFYSNDIEKLAPTVEEVCKDQAQDCISKNGFDKNQTLYFVESISPTRKFLYLLRIIF